MKVQSAQFVREIHLFNGIGRTGTFRAEGTAYAGVTAMAGEHGLQFSREKRVGPELVVEKVCVPYENVLRWTPPPEKRKAAEDSGKK